MYVVNLAGSLAFGITNGIYSKIARDRLPPAFECRCLCAYILRLCDGDLRLGVCVRECVCVFVLFRKVI